jgi:type I restriction enzyme R subunit
VVRIDIDKDIHGWTPHPGMADDLGNTIENRT